MGIYYKYPYKKDNTHVQMNPYVPYPNIHIPNPDSYLSMIYPIYKENQAKGLYNRQNEKYEFYKRKVQEETFEYSLNEVRTSLFHSVILYPFERSHIEFKQDIFTTFN